MERNNSRIRPQHQLLHNLIWAQWALRVHLGIKRDELSNFLVAPSSGEIRVPKWEILQLPDLPDTVLLDVLIFIDTALPPLYEAARMCILDTFMGASAHECTEASLSSGAITSDVDNVLHLGMIEEEAMDGPIAPIYEMAGESSDIKPSHSLFTPVATSNELYKGVWIVRIKINDLYLDQQKVLTGPVDYLTS
jgi:hypothetical protein